jgi:hypothetical protein
MLFFAGVALTHDDGAAGSAAARPVETGPVEASPVVAIPIDMSEIDRVDECIDALACIDRYLWSLYERTRKVDTVRVPEEIKVAVKQKGKIKIVTRTTSKWVTEDFGWKDPDAARKAGMAARDYVIGGMDQGFRVKLYHALRALDAIGLMPGITSAFRDDYRQTIASGQKAQSDRSYHGGSFRGGYGHGLAADIVSVRGETRAARQESSDVLWKWVDAHEKELGIARPYLDRDAPHVGPIEGQEYFTKRVEPKMRQAEKTKPSEKTHEAGKAHGADKKHQAEKTRQADKTHHDAKEHQAESKAKGSQEVALHADRGAAKRAKATKPARAQTKPTHST